MDAYYWLFIAYLNVICKRKFVLNFIYLISLIFCFSFNFSKKNSRELLGPIILLLVSMILLIVMAIFTSATAIRAVLIAEIVLEAFFILMIYSHKCEKTEINEIDIETDVRTLHASNLESD